MCLWDERVAREFATSAEDGTKSVGDALATDVPMLLTADEAREVLS
jgi:hypothetical protein